MAVSKIKLKAAIVFREYIEKIPNYQIFPVAARGIDFVGYIIYHNRVLIRKRIKRRFLKTNNRMKHKDVNLRYYKRKIAGYIVWFKYCDSYGFCIKHLLYTELLELIKQ